MRLQDGFVMAQVAFTTLLLTASGVVIKSFAAVVNGNPGFDPRGLLCFNLSLPASKYGAHHQQARFSAVLSEHLNALPGVRGAAVVTHLPMSRSNSKWVFSIDGRRERGPGDVIFARVRGITPEYPRVMGIALTRGRGFSEIDSAASLPVALVNEAMAARYFGGADPTGRRIKLGGTQSAQFPWMTIVGVVSDVRHNNLVDPPQPEIYTPLAQRPSPSVFAVVRRAAARDGTVALIRAAIRRIDPDLPISSIRRMEDMMLDSVAPQRLTLYALVAFGCVALLVAAIGLYGVVSYSVAQRTQEVGIRMALGASRGAVLRMVLRRGAALTGAGLIAGSAGAAAATHLLAALLYGVSPRDGAIFIAAPVIVAVAAGAATLAPGLRAARLEPSAALRYG
jgi:predicted permease